jgi:hypothetical protein
MAPTHLVTEVRELEKKRAEFTAFEDGLAQRELDLATLRAELNALRVRYVRTVGTLFIEVDELEARLAEALAASAPHDPTLAQEASTARAQAEASAEEAVAIAAHATGSDFTPSDDLNHLYRDIAKLVHPNLANDETERTRRHAVMATANKAYARGDVTRLSELLDEWVSSPGLVKGEGVGAELVRIVRKIHQVQRRLSRIGDEIAELKRGDMYVLKSSVDEALKQGRNLFEEMAAALRQRIEFLRQALSAV